MNDLSDVIGIGGCRFIFPREALLEDYKGQLWLYVRQRYRKYSSQYNAICICYERYSITGHEPGKYLSEYTIYSVT